jgi:DNA phosphorothioation-dependent restriction protein DptH
VTNSARNEAPDQPPPIEPSRPRGDQQASPAHPPTIDALVGANEMTPQYGVLGRSGSRAIAIDLTGCNTISIFGVQGFGKSYTLGVISEMATTPVEGVNVLPSPLAAVIFHYNKSDAYAPEMATAVAPNSKPREVEQLLAEYGARATGLRDVVLLAPEARVEDRRAEFPGLEVQPIKFASGELGAEGWKFLLGAAGSDALYVRQLVAIMRKYRQGLTLDDFRREIETAELSSNARRLAEDRLNLAAPYVDDGARLADLLRPGRTVIVDLRDEWVEKDEALGLFVVMLRIFATAKYRGRSFNKLVVFDEAHKYITDSELVGQVVETIREMRHQGTSVVIASQDPLSVPRAVVELTSILLLHRMTSPQWLKHLKSAIGALEQLTDVQVAALQPGEALMWAQRSTDKRFTQRPQRICVRPRFSQHGGGTKTAVSGTTVR